MQEQIVDMFLTGLVKLCQELDISMEINSSKTALGAVVVRHGTILDARVLVVGPDDDEGQSGLHFQYADENEDLEAIGQDKIPVEQCTFEVQENGEVFATTCGPRDTAFAEACRYAAPCTGDVAIYEAKRILAYSTVVRN